MSGIAGWCMPRHWAAQSFMSLQVVYLHVTFTSYIKQETNLNNILLIVLDYTFGQLIYNFIVT